jgi:hypothetical protein
MGSCLHPPITVTLGKMTCYGLRAQQRNGTTVISALLDLQNGSFPVLLIHVFVYRTL